MANGCLYPSSPVQFICTEATEGVTKGFVSQSPRLVTHQVFKYIARCEGGSRAVPRWGAEQAVSCCSPLMRRAPASAGCGHGVCVLLLCHPLSISIYTMQHRDRGLASGLPIFFSDSTFTAWSSEILHQAFSMVL